MVGLDANGMPVAWDHRFAGSSVIARWAPPFFKNGLDSDTTEGAINPDTIQAQIQSAIMFGITAALYGAITLKDGRVEQSKPSRLSDPAHEPGPDRGGSYRREPGVTRRNGRSRERCLVRSVDR